MAPPSFVFASVQRRLAVLLPNFSAGAWSRVIPEVFLFDASHLIWVQKSSTPHQQISHAPLGIRRRAGTTRRRRGTVPGFPSCRGTSKAPPAAAPPRGSIFKSASRSSEQPLRCLIQLSLWL